MVSQSNQQRIEPMYVTPLPPETVAMLDQIGWAHRFNTLIQEREWRHLDGGWQRDSSRVQSKIRSDLRGRVPLITPEVVNGVITPRTIAMQSIWGEVVNNLDSALGQQFDPIEYNDNNLVVHPPDYNILPWFDLMQRRINPAPNSIHHPEIIVLRGTKLLPDYLTQYTDDLFEVVPLDTVSNRQAMNKKFHGKNKKVLVYTTTDPKLAIELINPTEGILLGHYWATRIPHHEMPPIKRREVEKENAREPSPWAGTMAERIATELQSGKTINEYLVVLGHFANLDEALVKTRTGAEKAGVNDIAYCLRERYGWENRRQGKARLWRWFNPDVEQEDGE